MGNAWCSSTDPQHAAEARKGAATDARSRGLPGKDADVRRPRGAYAVVVWTSLAACSNVLSKLLRLGLKALLLLLGPRRPRSGRRRW